MRFEGGRIRRERLLMDGMDATSLAALNALVIVSSTHGHGEITDNGQALFASLEAGVDLTGKGYAMLALGNRTYADTFWAASDRRDAALAASAARRFIDVERHDASNGRSADPGAMPDSCTWASSNVRAEPRADAIS
jgi:MioC protein